MRLKDAPKDVAALATSLGYSSAALAGLKQAHGAKLLPRLQREWWAAQDHPRLLHRDSSHGYTESTSQSLPLEPEAVPAKYQAELSVDRRKHFLESRAEDRARTERLKRVQAQARKRGINVKHHKAAIEARIRAIEVELDG